jgi:hypothetical protein
MGDVRPHEDLPVIAAKCRQSLDELERWRAKDDGCQVLMMPTEEHVAIKLRELLTRGVNGERIGWCKQGVMFIIVVHS